MKSWRKIAVLIVAAAMTLGLVTVFGPAKTKADIKLVGGLMCLNDEKSPYDSNFLQTFINAGDDHGLIKGETYQVATNIADGEDCYDLAVDMSDRGCYVVFAYCPQYEDNIIEAAEEESDVQYCLIGGSKASTAGVENFQNGYAAVHGARYLAGIAAGMKLNDMIAKGDITEEEAKMGYVGSYTIAETISSYTAFYLGAKSVCPGVTMEVSFTGSWNDEEGEKEAAQKLINSGCVLISQNTDSLAVPTVCEEAGIPDVPCNGSTIEEAPGTYLISSGIDWTPYFSYCMDCILVEEDIADDWTGTFENGSVYLTEVNDAVAAEGTTEALTDAQAKLESGEIRVFDVSAFTVAGETVTSYLVDIDGDGEGETEAIADGAFQESVLRSAPYFDLQIDGITLLDTADLAE